TKEEKEDVIPSAASKSDVVFKVQLLASAKSIPLNGQNFNGLDQLSREPFKNLYRYMYGNAPTLEEAKRLKANADAKGYTTSYIVAYKNGKRVPISQAVN
ncbi:MAG: N-acetylmuramoyl-L-alanine amidase, partial [Muricauda sp.]|nr:N-acetylmuramoyl-L-alanine amidase [Allomuricauda sp.]